MIDIHGGLPQQPVGTAGTQPTNDSPYSPETVRKMNVPKGMAFFSISKGAISFTWGNSVIFVGNSLLFERPKKTSIDVVQTTWEIVVEKTDVVYVITS